MKKLLALALTLVMTLGLVSPALAEETLYVEGEPLPEMTLEEYQRLMEGSDDLLSDMLGVPVRLDPVVPTLNLYVDGEMAETVITAKNGVSYADAEALRQLFGPQAVPADLAGPLPIRAIAEAAGWDVGWYENSYGGVQEVQLWHKASYEAALAEEFGPMNGFFAKAMDQSMDLLFSETPISGHETVDVELTRFSTLDENKEYTLKLGVDYVMQKGVMDITLTFDVSQLLQFVDPRDLAGWAKEGNFTVAQLTALLKAGTAELILDYNENTMAYNVPLLALFDEDEAGWQTVYSGTSLVLPDLDEFKDFSFVSSLYATMTTTAGYIGAEYAKENYESQVAWLSLFLGKDRFSTQGGKTTYSMTTQGMNRAVGELIAQAAGLEEAPQVSLFKHCELTYTLDEGGNMDMELHFRPDVDGIRNAVAAYYDGDDTYYGMATLLGLYLPALDMDVTANGRGNQGRYVSGMNVHWNNVGTMELRCAATSGTALTGPRQIEDV